MKSTKSNKAAQQYDSQLQQELGMLSTEMRELAEKYQLDTHGHTKQELIRSIQRREGNFDCFASATAGECDQTTCLWRKDCLV